LFAASALTNLNRRTVVTRVEAVLETDSKGNRMKSLVLGMAFALSSNIAHAGVAFLETSSGDAQWIVAASPSQLSLLSDQWSSSVSHAGGASARIRCENSGWVASFYDGQARSFGVACGYGVREEAEQAALRECSTRGGRSCLRVFSGYDDGSWTDARPGGGQNHLKDIQN
jgi:hypothetical protein